MIGLRIIISIFLLAVSVKSVKQSQNTNNPLAESTTNPATASTVIHGLRFSQDDIIESQNKLNSLTNEGTQEEEIDSPNSDSPVDQESSKKKKISFLHKWGYFDLDKLVTCMKMELTLELNFEYMRKDNSSKQVTYKVPAKEDYVKNGSCNDTTEQMTVNLTGTGLVVEVTFDLNKTSSDYDLSRMIFKVNVNEIYEDAKNNQTLEFVFHGLKYNIPKGKSYICHKAQTLSMSANNSKEASIGISNLSIEAFAAETHEGFPNSINCEPSDATIVMIAVGCTLATLVLVILLCVVIRKCRSYYRERDARRYINM